MNKLEDEWNAAQPIAPDVQAEWDAATPPATTPKTWGQATAEGVTNIPSSAIKYGKDIISTLLHPIDTAKNVADLVVGGAGKGAEYLFPGSGNLAPAQKAKVDALRKMLAERYGGAENIKQTLSSDPVGMGVDLSSVITGGGSLAARMPGMMGKVGPAVASAGRLAEPVNMVKQAVGSPRFLIPESFPMRRYESAIKTPAPTKSFTREQQLEALQAGIDAGIYPTTKGAGKVQEIIDTLNDQIMGKIEEGTKAGEAIKTADVVKRLDAAVEHFKRLPESDEYLAQIDKIRKGAEAKGPTLSLNEAQKTKQDIGRLIKKEYGKLSSATVEANKQIARGLKEEIVTIFPEIKSLNTQESLMLRLQPVIEKAAARISKKDLMGIGTPIAGGAGAVIGGGKVGAAALVAKAVLDHPNVKTFIAIHLNKAMKGKLTPGLVDQRLAAYWASKMSQEQQAPEEPFPF